MKLEEVEVYQYSMRLGDAVWCAVLEWDFFFKDTVGKQLVRAVDSVAANLSEGFGRYHYKENKQFCYYARGSLSETRTWLDKARSRGLIAAELHTSLKRDIDQIGVKLNKYIRAIGPRP